MEVPASAFGRRHMGDIDSTPSIRSRSSARRVVMWVGRYVRHHAGLRMGMRLGVLVKRRMGWPAVVDRRAR
mgnify:CR=1 FL=1